VVRITSLQGRITEVVVEDTDEEEEEEGTEGEYGTRLEVPTVEMIDREEELQDQVAGEVIVMEEDGEVVVVAVTKVPLYPLIIGGRKMVPVTDTMVEVEVMEDVVEEEEMIEEEAAELPLLRTGPSPRQGMKGWKRSCLVPAMVLLESISTGTRTFL
jgi:hypothetical protein